jgi:hypothetical protein
MKAAVKLDRGRGPGPVGPGATVEFETLEAREKPACGCVLPDVTAL